jgi:hypothetical protein
MVWEDISDLEVVAPKERVYITGRLWSLTKPQHDVMCFALAASNKASAADCLAMVLDRGAPPIAPGVLWEVAKQVKGEDDPKATAIWQALYEEEEDGWGVQVPGAAARAWAIAAALTGEGLESVGEEGLGEHAEAVMAFLMLSPHICISGHKLRSAVLAVVESAERRGQTLRVTEWVFPHAQDADGTLMFGMLDAAGPLGGGMHERVWTIDMSDHEYETYCYTTGPLPFARLASLAVSTNDCKKQRRIFGWVLTRSPDARPRDVAILARGLAADGGPHVLNPEDVSKALLARFRPMILFTTLARVALWDGCCSAGELAAAARARGMEGAAEKIETWVEAARRLMGWYMRPGGRAALRAQARFEAMLKA